MRGGALTPLSTQQMNFYWPQNILVRIPYLSEMKQEDDNGVALIGIVCVWVFGAYVFGRVVLWLVSLM
jgi:hypothetical protein